MVKTVYDALLYGTNTLKEHNIESYLIDAKVMLCHLLNCDKNYLLVHKNDEISSDLFSNPAHRSPMKIHRCMGNSRHRPLLI